MTSRESDVPSPGTPLRFKVDSNLVGELGERLVATNHVALSELIKNSYDADATKVTVRFIRSGSGSKKSEIEVTDNGHAMTFDQVERDWMRVATANKQEEPISPAFGRRKTGSKGIGRFACQRLAGKLILTSRARLATGKIETTILTINWADFVPGSLLTAIDNAVERSVGGDGEPGLSLRLVGLRDLWLLRDFRTLRRQIIALTNSKGEKRRRFQMDPGFDIALAAPEFEEEVPSLSDQLMEAAWGRLQGEVSADGHATLILDGKDLRRVRYEPDAKYSLLREATIDLAIAPARKEYYRIPEVLSVSVRDEIMSEVQGVRVYLDGFRVYPYGDIGDDWLDLDKDSARNVTVVPSGLQDIARRLGKIDPARAMLNRPRNVWLYGGVYLRSKQQPIFVVKSNREGFVENEGYRQLQEFCKHALDWVTLYYSLFVIRRSVQKVNEIRREMDETAGSSAAAGESNEPLQAALDLIGRSALQLEPESTPEQIKDLKAQFRAGVKVVDAFAEQSRQELSALRLSASTGVLVAALAHDIRSVLGALGTIAAELDLMSKARGNADVRKIGELSEIVRSTRSRLESQLTFFGVLQAQTRQRARERVEVGPAVKEIFDSLDYLRSRNPFVPDYSAIPVGLKTPPMLRGEFYSILVNLVTNALKAVWASTSGSKIKVRSSVERGTFTLDVLDDGVGAPDDFVNNPSDMYTSDPEGKIYPALRKKLGTSDLVAIGPGTGLGLSIVQSIVSSYGGTFRFIEPKGEWRTVASVRIPE